MQLTPNRCLAARRPLWAVTPEAAEVLGAPLVVALVADLAAWPSQYS